MFVVRIIEVFLPSAIAADGSFCSVMEPPHIGFRVEVVRALDWKGNIIPDSAYAGTQHIVIEKATREAAAFCKGDTATIPEGFLTQGLETLSREEWLAQTRVLINHHDASVLKRSTV